MHRSATSISTLALAAAMLLSAPSATGAPPTPVDPTPEIFAAGDACAFPVAVAATGKSGFIDLPHNPQFSAISPSPGLRVSVTRLGSVERTVTVNATGAFRFIDLPDGSLEIRASGHNILYGYPEVGATAIATTGPVTLHVAADGELVGLDVSGARVRDLCAELG